MEERIKKITDLQEEYGLSKAQSLLNSGEIWKFEGHVGRTAHDLLEAGVLFLPEKRTSDYYGNIIPSRNEVKPNTMGSLENAEAFWNTIENGDFESVEYVEQFRGFMDFGFAGVE